MTALAYLGRPVHAVAQETHAVAAVVPRRAVVELLEIDGVLQGTVLD